MKRTNLVLNEDLLVRSGVDCLIAACALRNNLTVLHKDRDFHLLAKVSELRVQNL